MITRRSQPNQEEGMSHPHSQTTSSHSSTTIITLNPLLCVTTIQQHNRSSFSFCLTKRRGTSKSSLLLAVYSCCCYFKSAGRHRGESSDYSIIMLHAAQKSNDKPMRYYYCYNYYKVYAVMGLAASFISNIASGECATYCTTGSSPRQ